MRRGRRASSSNGAVSSAVVAVSSAEANNDAGPPSANGPTGPTLRNGPSVRPRRRHLGRRVLRVRDGDVSALKCLAAATVSRRIREMKYFLLFLALISLCHAELRSWPEYRTILWMGDSPWKDPSKKAIVFQRLQEMGINTGMVTGDESPERYVSQKMHYYVENIVNKGLCLKWSSGAKDWDAMVTKWAKTGRGKDAMVREYSFDDPGWREWARGKMREAVKVQAPHGPLLYDIRDELSTTISANPFDYDFSPVALQGFRAWLRTRYASLEKLNAQWETQFPGWDAVVPFTSDEIKNRQSGGGALPRGNPDWQALQNTRFELSAALKDRTRWNFAPWCDHRTYMDDSLAGVLDDLRQTARKLDPLTPVGIEGTQMASAFGGYDLWKLSRALDWLEPYDIGNSRDILGSFMPGKPFLTTVGEPQANQAGRRLWHLLLEGDRGCIVWWSEDSMDFSKPDYPLTERGKAIGGVMKEMTSPLASLWLKAQREVDDVLVLYSQPSLQVGWLIESTEDGSTWPRRFSSYEAQHNRQARVRDGWWKGLQDLGLTPRFVSSEQLVKDWKPRSGGTLVLPQCLALSDAEIAKIKEARAAGVKVLMNADTGVFDEHGTLRASAPFPDEGIVAEESGNYPQERMKGGGSAFLDKIAAGISIRTPVSAARDARLRFYRHRLGKGLLIGVERGISYAMSEALTQAGGNEPMETPLKADLKVPDGFCYDLRTGKLLGRNQVSVVIDPWRPTLLAVLEKETADVIATLIK